MSYSSRLLEEAVEAFSRLPGIGKKSALRMAMYLIREDKSEMKTLFVEPVDQLISNIKFCEKCNNISDDDVCNICQDREHKAETICVVQSIRDVMAIEDTAQYKGIYHVLGGVISPLDGVTADDLNIDTLIERAQSDQVKEVILAISPTIEGETTIFYLSKKLKEAGVKITQLARGISFGGELEYADEMTLGRSLMTRTEYKLSEI